MSAALRYLEEAKIEELAREYEHKGFVIAKNHQDDGVTYDLVASNDQSKIAIEVKARAALSGYADEIKRQREVAQAHGYSFQLFIVNPPLERQIQFDDIEMILFRHLTNDTPEVLDELSSHTYIDAVSDVDISTIHVANSGIDIAGAGMVEVTLEYGGGAERDGISWSMSFPFDFTALLNHKLEITEMQELTIDTSSFYG